MQAPGKCAAHGILKRMFMPSPRALGMAIGMAVWGDRMAFTTYGGCNIAVHDLTTGVHLHTFGKRGCGAGQFQEPTRLCAHPNGNLLVLEKGNDHRSGNERVQEVTWTGEHVRFIFSAAVNGWWPRGVAVSADGFLIAVAAGHGEHIGSIEMLDGKTCGTVMRFPITYDYYPYRHIGFSPDGTKVVVGGNAQLRPAVLRVRARCDGTVATTAPQNRTDFGASSGTLGTWQHVEFTDAGDVVLDLSQAVAVDQRPDLGALIEGLGDLQLFDRRDPRAYRLKGQKIQ